jgi:hypothetical protein
MQKTETRERIAELERRLAELKKRLPAHSIPATMMLELEQLEDKLDVLRRELDGKLQLSQS